MNDTKKANTEDADLRSFVKTQIARNQKAAKNTWIAGILVILFLIAYLSGVLYLVRGILVPTTAACMIAQSVEGNVPGLLAELEQSLKSEAVPLANNFSKSVMAAMPKVRAEAEAQIDRTYEEWLPELQDSIQASIHAYVVEHEADLKLVYATQKQEGFAKVFVDELSKEIVRELNAKIAAQTPQYDLAYVQTVSLNTLKDINEQLNLLARKKVQDMTRSERLQRRLIVSWTQALDELLRMKASGQQALVE